MGTPRKDLFRSSVVPGEAMSKEPSACASACVPSSSGFPVSTMVSTSPLPYGRLRFDSITHSGVTPRSV